MNEKGISICPQCGEKFECGAKAGLNTCWCFSYPHVLSPSEGTECLCPKCLEAKISAVKAKTKTQQFNKQN